MPRPLMFAAAAVALTLSACNRDTEEPVDDGVPPPAAEAGAPAASAPAEPELPAATTAQGFAARAALSDMFEIQSSQMALERSQNPGIRQFAQRMIQEHQTMTNQMQAALAQAGVTVAPPAELDAAKATMLGELRGAGPADFDKRYVAQQIEAHESALNLFRDYAGNGDTPALQEFAERGAPTIENHLQTARALEKAADRPAAGTSAPAAT